MQQSTEALPPTVLEVLSRHAGGIVTNRELMAAGCTSWDLTAWVRAGVLKRPTLGLYTLPDVEEDAAHRIRLAQRYLARRQRNFRGAGSTPLLHLLSGAAVAHLHGATHLASDAVTALIPNNRRVRLTHAPFHVRHADLAGQIPVVVDGLRVAEAARAVGDLAAGAVSDDVIREAVDRLRWRGMDIVPAVQLWRTTDGPGFVRLVRMTASGCFEQESDGERDLYRQIGVAGLPRPDCQVWLTPSTRVDFAYLNAGLVLEYHGEEAHRDRVDRDAARVFDLLQRGYDTFVVTKSMMMVPSLVPTIEERRRRGIRDISEGRRPPPMAPLQRPRLTPLRTI